ncbi:MAG: TonB-dependent receptor [Vicinamibacterales bacterium]
MRRFARCHATYVLAGVVGLMFVVCAPSSAQAQGGTVTASLSGRVTDDTGSVLPGVGVSLVSRATNQMRTVTTNAEGIFRFAGLPPGTYAIQAELQGFAPFARPDITLNVGSASDLNFVMRISSVIENITVTGEAPLVESSRTDLSTVITTEQIETLPSNSRNYLDFALLTPGIVENASTPVQGVGLNVGGGRSKEGALLVDGFWNTDESFTWPRLKYSQDAIAEFQVVSLGATAEFGRAIGGVVTAVTKSGGNDLSGSAYGFFRNEALNSLDPLQKARGGRKSEFDRQLYGGTVGGPVVRDRAFFFGAGERLQQDTPRDNSIRPDVAAIIGLPPADVGDLNEFLRDTFGMGKVSWQLTPNHTLTASYVMTREAAANAFVPFRTRARQGRLAFFDQAFQASWTGIARGGDWLHELKAAYFPRDFTFDFLDVGGPPLAPEGQLRQQNAPFVDITGIAAFGGGKVFREMFTRPWQVVYASTLSRKSHSVKFGVDAMLVDFTYFEHKGPSSGVYVFRSLDHYLRREYTTYTQGFGDPRLDRYHTYFSGYIQDSWRAHDRLTVNYGLRYDVELHSKYHGQSFGEDHNNFGPRGAVSYDVTGAAKTFMKLSGGLYFDRIFQNPIQETFFVNKDVLQQVNATWLFGQPGAPVFPSAFGTTLPPTAPASVRDVFIVPDDTAVPGSAQVVATLDHAIREDLAISVSGLYSRAWNKELLFDRNLAFNDATGRFVRPDPAFRKISQYSWTGRAEYTAVVGEIRTRLAERLRLEGNLTVARAYDQGDNYNIQVNDVRFPELEWGPQVDTPRARLTLNGSYNLTRLAQVSGIFRARTGFAYDARSGPTFDLNGDGNFNDRTPGFERNAFRAEGTHSLDARLTVELPIRLDARVQVLLEAFNLYNRANVKLVESRRGPSADALNPTFGQPLSYFNPREIQLGVRVVF